VTADIHRPSTRAGGKVIGLEKIQRMRINPTFGAQMEEFRCDPKTPRSEGIEPSC
jgi:hypothetical protein